MRPIYKIAQDIRKLNLDLNLEALLALEAMEVLENRFSYYRGINALSWIKQFCDNLGAVISPELKKLKRELYQI
jgi:hypothetical protein